MIACCAIVGYGNEKHPLFEAIRNPLPEQQDVQTVEKLADVSQVILDAIDLANRTHTVIFQRYGDDNILPYIHVTLVFIHRLTFLPELIDLVGKKFPWKLLSQMLNTLMDSVQDAGRIEGEDFWKKKQPSPRPPEDRPLPEDYAMRGLLWTDDYFPAKHWDGEPRDDDEKYMELPSRVETRKERVLYLGCRIATREGGKWLRYDKASRKFSAAPEFEIDLTATSPGQQQHDPELLKDALHFTGPNGSRF